MVEYVSRPLDGFTSTTYKGGEFGIWHEIGAVMGGALATMLLRKPGETEFQVLWRDLDSGSDHGMAMEIMKGAGLWNADWDLANLNGYSSQRTGQRYDAGERAVSAKFADWLATFSSDVDVIRAVWPYINNVLAPWEQKAVDTILQQTPPQVSVPQSGTRTVFSALDLWKLFDTCLRLSVDSAGSVVVSAVKP